MSVQDWIAVIAGLTGAFVALYNAWSSRDATASEAWSKLLTPLRERVDELERQVVEQDKEIVQLRRDRAQSDRRIADMESLQKIHEDGIRRLAAQVISLGGKPVYALPEEPAA